MDAEVVVGGGFNNASASGPLSASVPLASPAVPLAVPVDNLEDSASRRRKKSV